MKNASGALVESYTYSKAGDRLTKTAPGLATGTYGYQSGTHRLTTIGTGSRTYDANGSTTGNASAGVTWGYGYNGRGQMTVLQQAGTTVATYAYDASARRIAKTVGSATTRFAYGPGGLLGEYGGASRDYVWMDDTPVAVVDGIAVAFVHADGLNTPRAVTNVDGAVVWSWAYQGNPFGEQAPTSTGGYLLNLRFAGQYGDRESGLLYNIHRYYDSATGRYTQSDPIGLEGGPSTYAYVGGNPLSNVDPWGLCDCTGTARVMQGNARHIGKAGGLGAPGTINSTSAALIPSQWGGKLALRANYNQVSVTNAATGAVLFDNAHDVAGGDAPAGSGYSNVRDWFTATSPNTLYIELPGASADQGTMQVNVHTPDGMPCPTGTTSL